MSRKYRFKMFLHKTKVRLRKFWNKLVEIASGVLILLTYFLAVYSILYIIYSLIFQYDSVNILTRCAILFTAVYTNKSLQGG